LQQRSILYSPRVLATGEIATSSTATNDSNAHIFDDDAAEGVVEDNFEVIDTPAAVKRVNVKSPQKRMNLHEMIYDVLIKLIDRENPQQKVLQEAVEKLMKFEKYKTLTTQQKLRVKAQLGKDQEAFLFSTYDDEEVEVFINQTLKV